MAFASTVICLAGAPTVSCLLAPLNSALGSIFDQDARSGLAVRVQIRYENKRNLKAPALVDCGAERHEAQVVCEQRQHFSKYSE